MDKDKINKDPVRNRNTIYQFFHGKKEITDAATVTQIFSVFSGPDSAYIKACVHSFKISVTITD